MLLVRSQSLHAKWRGSIDVNAFRVSPGALLEPIAVNVSVQGDSVVNTLWGHVPCWRVVIHLGRNPEQWFVSKDGHEVLRVTGPKKIQEATPRYLNAHAERSGPS